MAKINGRTGLVLFLVISIAIFTLIRYTNFDRKELSTFERIYKDTLAPLQGGVMNVSHDISSYFRAFLALNTLKGRNEALQKEVDRLQGQLVEMENLRYENERFKALLRFKDSNYDNFRLEGATVIARSSENWFSSITIGKGEAHGVTKNMAVISPKGLVGHVTAVSKNTSEVLLILDPRSAAGAFLQKSRAPGVVEGIANVGDRVRMIHIPADTKSKPGEMVVTSGLGGIFPKGLPIGRVEKLEDEASGLTKRAIIKTFVNFNYLEEVFVVLRAYEIEAETNEKDPTVIPPIEEISPGEEGPPAIPADPTAGAAANE